MYFKNKEKEERTFKSTEALSGFVERVPVKRYLIIYFKKAISSLIKKIRKVNLLCSWLLQ